MESASDLLENTSDIAEQESITETQNAEDLLDTFNLDNDPSDEYDSCEGEGNSVTDFYEGNAPIDHTNTSTSSAPELSHSLEAAQQETAAEGTITSDFVSPTVEPKHGAFASPAALRSANSN
eukprot:m.129266 g.129266  ORF g.129266 m.129266 type:complete len:122 (+) comp15693_c7_seq1:2-367(+)